MSRRTSRLHRSPNTSMAALIGHPDRGSFTSPILLAIYHHPEYGLRERLQTTSGRVAVLRQVADGVLVHESEFCQSNAVVVQGEAGVLVVDAGVLDRELACLADDLSALGQPVVAGFSTHPHWDHLLWHPRLGTAPRYGTARCAATVQARLS